MKDITGKKYGKLTVLAPIRQNKESRWIWECLCDCGNKTEASKHNLEAGGKKECVPCSRKKLGFKHGGKGSKLYSIWCGMHARCKRKSLKAFPDYGGRGISVCERWNSFASFKEDMGEPPNGLQLDRINTNLGYSRENCRWVDPTVNLRNRRNSKRWIIDGKEFQSSCQAASHFGVSVPTIVRWCEGGEDKRRGCVFGPKKNCSSYKIYENS